MRVESTDYLYLLKALSDDTIAKAFGISEVGKIAKAEKRLREYVLKKWMSTAKKAARASRPRETPKQIRRAVERNVRLWEEDIRGIYLAEVEYIYRMARIAGFKKVTGKNKGSLQYDIEQSKVLKAKEFSIPDIAGVDFTLVDEKAIEAIKNQQLFWIGEFVDGFSESIEDTAREIILEIGEDPVRGATILRERLEQAFDNIKIPEGFTGTSARYFEGLVANAATVARVQGQLQSFIEADARAFMIVNPMDERTCGRCSLLDGLQFPIEQGVQQMEAEQEADTIDKVKAAHPWFPESRYTQIRNNSTDRDLWRHLADSGITLPPFHFKCRCTIDIV